MGFARPAAGSRRVLGVDLGDARTGLALGDTETRSCAPIEVLEIPRGRNSGRDLLRAIAVVARENLDEGGTIVVGLALNMDGSEGPRAKICRDFADALAKVCRHQVTLHDERLTSADAEDRLSQSGLTHAQKKARRDAIAAAAMLRDYLLSLPDAP